MPGVGEGRTACFPAPASRGREAEWGDALIGLGAVGSPEPDGEHATDKSPSVGSRLVGKSAQNVAADERPGSYPVPFTWTNGCASAGGSGAFSGNWQKQYLNPTSAACAMVIDLQGSGSGSVSLWYFAE